MKCPFRKTVVKIRETHIGDWSDRIINRETEEFAECLKSECPYYATEIKSINTTLSVPCSKTIEICRRAIV